MDICKLNFDNLELSETLISSSLETLHLGPFYDLFTNNCNSMWEIRLMQTNLQVFLNLLNIQKIYLYHTYLAKWISSKEVIIAHILQITTILYLTFLIFLMLP